MHRLLGTLLATAAVVASAGCGSGTSSTVSGPDSPGPGPVHGADILPLISMTAGGGHVSTHATLLDTDAQVLAFTSQFEPPAMVRRIDQAVSKARDSGQPVYGAVVAVGCDRPPGAAVSLDADGRVQITAHEVESPLPECLVPVTTVAIATVPGAD